MNSLPSSESQNLSQCLEETKGNAGQALIWPIGPRAQELGLWEREPCWEEQTSWGSARGESLAVTGTFSSPPPDQGTLSVTLPTRVPDAVAHCQVQVPAGTLVPTRALLHVWPRTRCGAMTDTQASDGLSTTLSLYDKAGLWARLSEQSFP